MPRPDKLLGMDPKIVELLKDEYLHKTVDDFDQRTLTIKAWSVTTSMVGIAASFLHRDAFRVWHPCARRKRRRAALPRSADAFQRCPRPWPARAGSRGHPSRRRAADDAE